MKYIYVMWLLISISSNGQTISENFVKSSIPKKEFTSLAALISSPIQDRSVTVNYYDGLGRSTQQIKQQFTSTGKDLISYTVYDSKGNVKKKSSPFSTSASSAEFHTNAVNEILNFPIYNSQNAEATNEYELTPSPKIAKQGFAGSASLGSGHEVKYSYQTNVNGDNVKYFKVSTALNSSGLFEPTLINASATTYCTSRQLYKNIFYDENTNGNPIESNGSSIEFVNREGDVILKRSYSTVENGSQNQRYDTYYVYDDFGNLTYVIPPKADGVISQDVLDNLCYQYKYDSRNRLAERKIPGKNWEFVIYDKADRVAATGPAFFPFGQSGGYYNGWLMTKYDVFNRVAYSAWYNGHEATSGGRKLMQDFIDQSPQINEARATSTMVGNVNIGHTNIVRPTELLHPLTINYYDDYNFPNAIQLPTNVENQILAPNVKGLSTGSWSRALTLEWEFNGSTTTLLYDKWSRVIRNYKTHYFGGYTQNDLKLDFVGKVLYTITKHKYNSTANLIEFREDFTYSNQERLIKRTHTFNNMPGMNTEVLAENMFDELGRLVMKKVGGSTSAPLQTVDYSYNIRGWLTGINNDSTNNLILDTNQNDLFGMKINYDIVEDENNYLGTPLYNGNISEISWRTSSDNMLRKYGFEYDALNRMNDATYIKSHVATNSYDESVRYDKNGNITSLQRNGDFDSATMPISIDDLVYTYAPNSNKLLKVTDTTNDPFGFKDDAAGGVDAADDYAYDILGNMIKDENKKINNNGQSPIRYNHLNLPVSIWLSDDGSKRIEYVYDGQGNKLKRTVFNGSYSTTVTDYINGFQYNNGIMMFFPTAEGYVNFDSGVYKYVYNYVDHLGNTRLSYTSSPDYPNGLAILQTNNFYPFGLNHTNYNGTILKLRGGTPIVATLTTNKYKYQGQERQDELGLNWDSFKWRNYDYAIGRFMSIDPLAEDYPYNSTYAFQENRMGMGRELEGLELVPWVNIAFGSSSPITSTPLLGAGDAIKTGVEVGGKAGEVAGKASTSSTPEAGIFDKITDSIGEMWDSMTGAGDKPSVESVTKSSRNKPNDSGIPNSSEIQGKDAAGKTTKYSEFGKDGKLVKQVEADRGAPRHGVEGATKKVPTSNTNPKTGEQVSGKPKIEKATPQETPPGNNIKKL